MKYKKISLKQKPKNITNATKDNLLNELLAHKNLISQNEIDKFLNPSEKDFISPYAFCDMEKAVKRIFEAIEKKETILVWGDFDCDGVTSSSILYKI